jgi:hypothetical protein
MRSIVKTTLALTLVFLSSCKTDFNEINISAKKLLDTELSDSNKREEKNIVVEGIGLDLKLATKDAEKKAIQQLEGDLVITERLAINRDLKQTDLSYSRGMIKDSKIIEYYVDSEGLVHAKVSVTVTKSKISKRVFSNEDKSDTLSPDTKKFFDDHSSITAKQEKRFLKARKIVLHLIEEYPWALFDSKIGSQKNFGEGYKLTTVIPVTITLNKTAKDRLMAALLLLTNSRTVYLDTKYQMFSQRGTNYVTKIISELTEKGLISKQHVVDQTIFAKIMEKLSARGVCLKMIDNKNKVFESKFFPIGMGGVDYNIKTQKWGFKNSSCHFMSGCYEGQPSLNLSYYYSNKRLPSNIRIYTADKYFSPTPNLDYSKWTWAKKELLSANLWYNQINRRDDTSKGFYLSLFDKLRLPNTRWYFTNTIYLRLDMNSNRIKNIKKFQTTITEDKKCI